MVGPRAAHRLAVAAFLLGALFHLDGTATTLVNSETSDEPSDEAGDDDPDAAPPVRRDVPWSPAVYRGLMIGVSRKADMIAALGEPMSAHRTMGHGHRTSYSYRTLGPIAGDLSVDVDDATGVIGSIRLRPHGVTRDELAAEWGEDFLTTHYDIDGCLSREEESRLYECEEGPLVYTEYREQGIAVSMDKNGEVREIAYVDGPIGSKSSRCGDPPIVGSASVPFYPDMARRARIEGAVRLRVTSDGQRVTDVETISGPPLLELAARENVRTWQFLDGRATEFEVTFRYALVSSSGRRESRTATLDFPYVVEVRAQPVVIDTHGCTVRSRDGD